MSARKHLTFANVASGLALFLVLTGGTAIALDGSNTVFSDDIVNDEVRTQDIRAGHVQLSDLGADAVTSAKIATGGVRSSDVLNENLTGTDIAANSLTGADVNESGLKLAAEGWHEVGAAGEPAFNGNDFCQWKNYDGGVAHNSAAFLRDRHGFVHLKGLVDADDVDPGDFNCDFSIPSDRLIFTLPNGYRPAKREVLVSISNGVLARISVDGTAALDQPAGGVSVQGPPSGDDARQWVSLDGLSFRCAPSGSNGCP